MIRRSLALASFALPAASPAFAHPGPEGSGSFAAGAMHPLLGADHLLAMVAVGMWAAMLGGRARWGVPAAFVGVMVLGFGLALAGAPLPFVEPMIMASVVALGLAIALAVRPDAGAGAALVGVFALFHGHAHGGEMGAAAAPAYLAGFALATAALHAAGLALGLATERGAATRGARVIGGGVAVVGAILVTAG